ncbi:unnamed protein product, partial [Gongylonema pulchrum]|uniref:C2H2-type domain-containing protein n=1 Tax=Gongylonema pulchrum TaxID=637853 RepID=A0A183DKG4_9BILA
MDLQGSVAGQLTGLQPTATTKEVCSKCDHGEAVASHSAALPQLIKLIQNCATEPHHSNTVKLSGIDLPGANFPSVLPIQTNSRSVLHPPQNSDDDDCRLGVFSSQKSADDQFRSDPFSLQNISEGKYEMGKSAQQSLDKDETASNLLLGGPSGCDFRSELPGDEIPEKLKHMIPTSPDLKSVEIWRFGLAGSQWFQTQNSTASQLVSPTTVFSSKFAAIASQFRDRIGDPESVPTSSKATRRRGLICGVCSQKFKFKLLHYFKKHLDSHNKRGEHRCNWLHCGVTVISRHILA